MRRLDLFTPAQSVLGPLTLTVENAVAYDTPLFTESPQATPDEMLFSFLCR